ncbi:hypothetical protein HMI55_006781 [Coelomomyces lativittatus]|nr:hypothetical protein HMI55_006781 [Coelomomyces lativittatus]
MEGKAAEAKYTQSLKLLQKQKTHVPELVQAQILRLTSELDAKSNLLHQYIQKETQGNLNRTFSTSLHPTEHTSSQLQKLSHSRLVEINLKLQTLLEEQTLKSNQLQEDVTRLNSTLLSLQIQPVNAVPKKVGNEVGPGK